MKNHVDLQAASNGINNSIESLVAMAAAFAADPEKDVSPTDVAIIIYDLARGLGAAVISIAIDARRIADATEHMVE